MKLSEAMDKYKNLVAKRKLGSLLIPIIVRRKGEDGEFDAFEWNIWFFPHEELDKLYRIMHLDKRYIPKPNQITV